MGSVSLLLLVHIGAVYFHLQSIRCYIEFPGKLKGQDWKKFLLHHLFSIVVSSLALMVFFLTMYSSEAFYHFSILGVLFLNCLLLSLPLLFVQINEHFSYSFKFTSLLGIMAIALVGVAWIYWYFLHKSEKFYLATEQNVPTIAKQLPEEPIRKQLEHIGYRLPVALPLCIVNSTQPSQRTIPEDVEVLRKAGVVELVHRISPVTLNPISIYQPSPVFLSDYDPVLGFKLADIHVDKITGWTYAEPVKRHPTVRTAMRGGKGLRHERDVVDTYRRVFEEPRLYTAEWRVDNFRPWIYQQDVQLLSLAHQRITSAIAAQHSCVVLPLETGHVLVKQIDSVAPVPFLAHATFTDRARLNDSNRCGASSIILQGETGDEMLESCRKMGETSRFIAYVEQGKVDPEHDMLIREAINAYLGKFAGFLWLNQEEMPQISKLPRENPPLHKFNIPEFMPVLTVDFRKTPFQAVPLVDDPHQPRQCTATDTNCLRYALFQVDKILSISKVYETTATDWFGYCQVRFSCKPLWIASWLKKKRTINEFLPLRTVLDDIATREMVWIIRINGIGWETGVRAYGGSYSVVYDSSTGSGI